MNTKKNKDNLLSVMPNDDVLEQCMHCGMCLAVCPTYNMTFVERSSPRGRIKMIKSVARGEMEITPLFADEMDFCLDCQACETACPAGVKYGSMVEAARVEVANAGFTTWWGKGIKFIALKVLLRYKPALKIVARFLWLYQKTGLRGFLHRAEIFKHLMPTLGEFDQLAPEVSTHFSSNKIKEITPPKKEKKYKVAFLTGCVMDVAFADINIDTVEFLSAIGAEVFTPKMQVCCGSVNAHNGDMNTAKKLAKINIDEFLKQDYDYLISNSAGCGAFMKEYGHALEDDPEYSEKAKLFSSKVKDLSEFVYDNLSEINFHKTKGSVTYHDACHLAHTQKITAQPRTIIENIPGLDISVLNEATWCCGSAGVYNIVRYDDSMQILERKMKNIEATGSETVLASNPGCILQLLYGAKKFNVPVKVEHPATLLRRAVSED